jgi:hypothetical protein
MSLKGSGGCSGTYFSDHKVRTGKIQSVLEIASVIQYYLRYLKIQPQGQHKNHGKLKISRC